MGKIYWILVGVCLLIACQGNGKKSANVLSEEQMVKALAEVYVTEEKINSLGLSQDSALQVFNILQAKIAANTGVTDSILKRSMNYYMEHPKELDKIYSVLIDTLQLREQRVSAGPQ